MITCLYAMKAIKDAGIAPNKKIRMILGANEETGWLCMDHYFGKLKMPQPDLAFTPDSTFPVTFAEKGILQVYLKKNYGESKAVLNGGNAFNSVADTATLKLSSELKSELEGRLAKFNAGKDFEILMSEEGDSIVLTSHGKSSHASRPHTGYNAISALMSLLAGMDTKDAALNEVVSMFADKIKMEYNGQSIGVGFEDVDSGKLTLNIGMISLVDGELSISVDMRYPVTIEKKTVIDGITAEAAEYKMEVSEASGMDALYVQRDHFLVETLMDVYREITGDVDAQPAAIGGGTYARAVKNGVAFGALLHDQEDNMHQKNEYLDIDKLDTWLKIYVEAIHKLSK